MFASPELMDNLRGIGLNLYERKLWVALLARGVGTAGELSTMAKVPRSRTYDVLQTLADKGFVIIQSAKPLKYVAIPPEEALGKAKQKLKNDLNVKLERIERLKGSKLLDELKNIHQQGFKLVAPEDLTGALKGRTSIIQQMDSMLKDASLSVDIMATHTGVKDLFENHFSTLKSLKQKGIKVRIAAKHNEGNEDAIKALSGVADVRRIHEKNTDVHGNFAIVDNKQMMLGLTDLEENPSEHMVFWTKSPHAAGKVGSPLFNLVWEKSLPAKK